MAEIQFARQFLTILESRPVKLSSDYVLDAKQLPPQPAYVLPRLDKPKLKPRRSPADGAAAGASGTVTVTLKPLKGTAVTLRGVDPTTASVYDIKTRLGKRTGYNPEKIKVLWQKRPVTDAKTLKDVVGDAVSGDAVELGVMYIGQPTAEPLSEEEEAGVGTSTVKDAAAGAAHDGDVPMVDVSTRPAAAAVMRDDAFWEDLEKYVASKIGDEKLASVAVGLWRTAWENKP